MKKSTKTIGILAFQGDVIEHKMTIQKLGQPALEVRSIKELKLCDALIIPGGESTTIGFFLEQTGIGKEITRLAAAGFPIFGTCAGAVVLAKNIVSNIIPPHLGLIDITIQRNAYGKQIDSFVTELEIPSLGIKDLKAAFIRAPIIQKTGPGVKILARHGNEIVLIRQGNILAATFHAELCGETRLHSYFLSF
jgi:5'-phosphate synthase pdxT subunit